MNPWTNPVPLVTVAQCSPATAQNPNGSCEVVNRERRAKKGEDQRESADPTEDVSPN